MDGVVQPQRVLLRREVLNFSAGAHPLFIDLKSLEVEPTKDEVWTTADWVFTSVNPADGGVYWVQEDKAGYGAKPRGNLWRIAGPDFARTKVASNVVQGCVQFMDGKVHILGKEWQVADSPAGPFQGVKFAPLPNLPERKHMQENELGLLYFSAHYGTMLISNGYLTGEWATAVELVPLKKE